jgi:hypothetical protein
MRSLGVGIRTGVGLGEQVLRAQGGAACPAFGCTANQHPSASNRLRLTLHRRGPVAERAPQPPRARVPQALPREARRGPSGLKVLPRGAAGRREQRGCTGGAVSPRAALMEGQRRGGARERADGEAVPGGDHFVVQCRSRAGAARRVQRGARGRRGRVSSGGGQAGGSRRVRVGGALDLGRRAGSGAGASVEEGMQGGRTLGQAAEAGVAPTGRRRADMNLARFPPLPAANFPPG